MSSPQPLPVHRCAGFIVYRRPGGGGDHGSSPTVEFLLLQSSGGRWGFPKGHLEEGETEWEAAVRETREECGLDLARGDLAVDDADFTVTAGYRSGSRRWGPHDKTVTFWLARKVREEAEVTLSNEHRAHRWAGREEALRTVDFQPLRQALNKCGKKLQEGGKGSENPTK